MIPTINFISNQSEIISCQFCTCADLQIEFDLVVVIVSDVSSCCWISVIFNSTSAEFPCCFAIWRNQLCRRCSWCVICASGDEELGTAVFDWNIRPGRFACLFVLKRELAACRIIGRIQDDPHPENVISACRVNRILRLPPSSCRFSSVVISPAISLLRNGCAGYDSIQLDLVMFADAAGPIWFVWKPLQSRIHNSCDGCYMKRYALTAGHRKS